MSSRTRYALWAAPAAVVMVGLLVGCSAVGADPSASESAKPASPLDPYYAVLYPQPDADAQKAADAAVQDAVAACMKEQGFEYTPDANAATTVVTDSMDVEWGSEEFARTYGYGISIDVSGAIGGAGEEHVDPNQGYLDSLSATERTAFNDALWGPPTGVVDGMPFVDASAQYDWHDGGCMGAAQHEHGLFADPTDDSEYGTLTEEMGRLSEKARSEPAVQAVESEWSACLAGAGFPGFEHKDDPMNDVVERFGALHGASGADAPATAPDTGPPEAGDPEPATLQAFQEEEIATAVADFDCARDTGYTETVQREQTRLEQEFVDQNKGRLDALVARLGAK